MRFRHTSTLIASAALALVVVALPVQTAPAPQGPPLYQQFLSNPNPLELVAAKKADRIAWTAYEEGRRNAYTAAGPAFVPVRLTSFLKDDGSRHLDDPDFGRWVDGRISPRNRTEPGRLGGERVGRSCRRRACNLGRAHQRRGAVESGRRQRA